MAQLYVPLLSGAMGVVLGVFGGGGSILAVPVLVYVGHMTPKTATGMSLAIVGTTSLVASHAYYRRGYVQPRIGLFFASAGIVTAFGGARLSEAVSGRVLMLVFAVFMALVGGIMWFKPPCERQLQHATKHLESKPRAAIAGAAVGAITGFLGVGGGFLVVPSLLAFTKLGMREAVGTSLLVIAVNSVAGFAGHLSDTDLDLRLVAVLTAASVLGASLGVQIAQRISVDRLRRGFALLVILIGLILASTVLERSAIG